jgi:HAD superfamily hydrolase (TIGR01509 family)
MDTRIDLVIFDCDGVLIDSEGLSAEVLIGALADLGVVVDFDYFCANFVGRSFPTVARDIQATFDLILPHDFEQNYRRDLLAKFAYELTPTKGVTDMLSALTARYCVATSSSPARVSNSLNIVDLTSYFGQSIFTASEVAFGKPAPDLFLHAAARMGVDPAHCLVIEDSLPGVEAALAANMRVLRYTGGAHLAARVLKHADYVRSFEKWCDLRALVPAIFAAQQSARE